MLLPKTSYSSNEQATSVNPPRDKPAASLFTYSQLVAASVINTGQARWHKYKLQVRVKALGLPSGGTNGSTSTANGVLRYGRRAVVEDPESCRT